MAQSSFNLNLPPEGTVVPFTLESPHVTDNDGSSSHRSGSRDSFSKSEEEELPEIYLEARKNFLKKSKELTKSSILSLEENISSLQKKMDGLPEVTEESCKRIEEEMKELHKKKKKEHRDLEDAMEDVESDKISVVTLLEQTKNEKEKKDSENFDILNPLEKKQTELKVTYDKMEGQKKNATLLLTQKLTTQLVQTQNETASIQKLFDDETAKIKEFKGEITYFSTKIEDFKVKLTDAEVSKQKVISLKDENISKIKTQNAEKEKEITEKEQIYIESLGKVKQEYEEQRKKLDKLLSEKESMKKQVDPIKEEILNHEENKNQRIQNNILKKAQKISELKIHEALNKSEASFFSTHTMDQSALISMLKELEEETKPIQTEYEEALKKRIEVGSKLLIKRKQIIDSTSDAFEKRGLSEKFEKENEMIQLSRMKSKTSEEMKSAIDKFSSELSSNKKLMQVKISVQELKENIKKKSPEEGLLKIEQAKTSISNDTTELIYQKSKIEEFEKRIKEAKNESSKTDQNETMTKLQALKEKVQRMKELAEEKSKTLTKLDKELIAKQNEKKAMTEKAKKIENEINEINEFTRQTGEERSVKLNVIKITDSVEEAEYIIEPLISLKSGITKFLKEVNKKCLDLNGKTITDIFVSDDSVIDRVDHLILKPLIHILNHGFIISQWYFTTGHLWRMLEDLSSDPKNDQLKKMVFHAQKIVDKDIKTKHREHFTTIKTYDAYVKALLIYCLQFDLFSFNSLKRQIPCSID
jgi:chromosome segregation ATPase